MFTKLLSSGFSVRGNGEHVCDDVNYKETSVKWRSVQGVFSCVDSDSNSSGGSIPIIVESVGRAIVSFIIPLSFVILYTRQSYKKRSCDFDNRIMIELDPDVT